MTDTADMLRQAQNELSEYRSKHGLEKARALLVTFGADPERPNLGTVPENRIPALLKALKGEPVARRAMSIGEVQGALAGMHDAVYRKWNGGFRRPVR